MTFDPPPAGFNFLKANESDLLRHGFPRRPVEDPALLKRWERTMIRPFRVIVPQFRRARLQKAPLAAAGRPPEKKAVHGSETSNVWSGVMVYVPGGTYDEVVEGSGPSRRVSPGGGVTVARRSGLLEWPRCSQRRSGSVHRSRRGTRSGETRETRRVSAEKRQHDQRLAHGKPFECRRGKLGQLAQGERPAGQPTLVA